MRQEVKVRAYLSEDVVGLLDGFKTKLMGLTMYNPQSIVFMKIEKPASNPKNNVKVHRPT